MCGRSPEEAWRPLQSLGYLILGSSSFIDSCIFLAVICSNTASVTILSLFSS